MRTTNYAVLILLLRILWPSALAAQPLSEQTVNQTEADAISDGAPRVARSATTASLAADEPDEEPEEEPHEGEFYFGSYGRVIGAIDDQGRTGRQNNFVAWGPRVNEDDSYAEVELRREDHFMGIHSRVVASVAYGGPFFHFDGDFSERIAIRNLFAEANDILTEGLSVWGGSRMWRGDDVYLLNFWPLDNLNTIGGGGRYALEDIGELSFVVGLAQPSDPFQRQDVTVPARTGFLPDTVSLLDRPRIVVGTKLTWWPFGRFESEGIKAILYGEGHALGEGDRRTEADLVETLPGDAGWVVGAQFGAYSAPSRSFVNVFVRYARGLAAYDPLGVPFREGAVIQTGRAEEFRVALSANWEHDFFALQAGGYFRYFRDAEPNVFSRGAISEGTLNLRPYVYVNPNFGVAVDLSYQGMAAATINERTDAPEEGHAFKLGVMPFFSPFGDGTYTRPHIRFIYTLTVRDDGARALYPELDPRSNNNIEHFFGIGVEWWFSSTSYGS